MFIFTEGNNTTYLNQASSFYLNTTQREKIKIIENIKDISSADELKVLFNFFIKLNQKKQILFVWDCDCGEKKVFSKLLSLNNVYPFIFEKNLENTVAPRGVENLFPEEIFEGFINETKKSNGDIHKVFDGKRKRDFENVVLKKGTKEIFKKFNPLFEKIKTILE